MPKSYSGDLRERVIEAAELGTSRREAAERFEVSVSSAVKWLQRWRESGSAAPKPRGGQRFSIGRAARVLAVCCRTARPNHGGDRCGTAQAADSNQPQFTLAVSRPTRSHPQKKPASHGTSTSRCGPRAPTLDP